MKINKALLAAGVLLAGVTAWAAPSFLATPEDNSLQALVGRWVQGEGKKLVWEAEGDAAIDPVALNARATLQGAANFRQALERLNRALDEANQVPPKKPRQLVACVFDDAIVIRTIDQPNCGKPL